MFRKLSRDDLPRVNELFQETGFQPGGGESLLTLSARSVAAFTRLAGAHRGQTIAIVAHGGVLDALYRAAVGAGLDAPRTWQLGNATVNRLLYTGEGFQPKKGGGVGLANIRERLSTLYGKSAKLTLEENQPRGVVSTIEVPQRGVLLADAA